MVEESAQVEERKDVVATTFVGENLLLTQTPEEREARKQEIMEKAEAFSHYTDRKDEFRTAKASSSGGFELRDSAQTALLRSAGTEIISMMGRKILSGDFNLTRISFPIKCMSAQSMLMTITGFASTMPVYFNRAAKTTDPVERLKLVMTCNFSWFVYNSVFAKPLNPILGETFQCEGQDGTKIYLEQTSHHPPRSHVQAEGPDGNFNINGYTECAIYAGVQTSKVVCQGFREITFKDGGKIRWSLNNDYLSGLFIGTINHQLTGKCTFTDEANGLTAYYEYGAYMFKKQDYVYGEIHQNGKKVSQIFANYNGWMDFDGIRYWDVRQKDDVYFPIAGEVPDSLPSQASKRSDGRFLISLTIQEAQAEKERLENLQRHDRKLREEAAARRQKGGPKFKPRAE